MATETVAEVVVDVGTTQPAVRVEVVTPEVNRGKVATAINALTTLIVVPTVLKMDNGETEMRTRA